jgi:replicative DNA helicase
MSEQVDTLKKFGADFQNKCVAGLISDRAFLERISDILEADYFESDSAKWIVDKTKGYFYQYKSLPSMTVFKVYVDELANEVLKTSVIETLHSVYMKTNEPDLVFVKEQFLEFCQNQKMKAAILDSVDLLKLGQYEKIKFSVENALKAGMERNVGHDYMKDFEARMTEETRNCIPTGWGLIDELLNGGLGAGELGVVIGMAGGGKSWCLCKVGAEALRKGKTVLHYTLELNEKYVGKRYDACFTGIDFQELVNHKDKVKAIVEDSCKGDLVIKYYPTKTVSALTIKSHAERMILLGRKPDLIVVDYADILKSIESNKNSNSYQDAGSIYEELRGVAGELQIPIWTCSQSNRGAADEDVIQAHNVADSFRKIMTADFVMSLSRKMEDKASNTARFHVIKNRFGPDGLTYPARMRASCGDIQIFDSKSQEGMEIQSEMNDGENVVKKMLKDEFEQVKKNRSGF